MGTMGEPRLTSTLCPPPGPTEQGLASTGEENCTNVPGTGTFFPCTCSLRIDPPEEPHRRCLPAPIAIIGRYPRPYKVQTASQKLVELRLAIRKSHVRCAVMFTGVFRYWLHRFAPGSASSGSPARTGPRALCVIDDRPCARYAALPVPASGDAPAPVDRTTSRLAAAAVIRPTPSRYRYPSQSSRILSRVSRHKHSPPARSRHCPSSVDGRTFDKTYSRLFFNH